MEALGAAAAGAGGAASRVPAQGRGLRGCVHRCICMHAWLHPVAVCTRNPPFSSTPPPHKTAQTDFVVVDESQDLRAEDVEILGRLVEQQQRNGGPLKRVLVVGDTEQTVFSDVIAQGSEHPLDLLPAWMPSVDVLARRLDINYRCVTHCIYTHPYTHPTRITIKTLDQHNRCPHPHVAFNNLAMPRAPAVAVRPSPEMAARADHNATAHKPYLFTYELSASTTLNYDAYRTANRISEMVLALLRTMDGLRLKDVAITR